MKKRILAFLLAIFMCLSLFGCAVEVQESRKARRATAEATEFPETQATESTSGETKPSQITPNLYKITDSDGNTAYLFGSIHVGKPEFYPLPEYVQDAFEASDALAVEADIIAFEKDMVQQVQALQLMMYADGTTIRDHISEDLYTAAVEIMKGYGQYNAALDYYVPSFWSSMIDSLMVMDLSVDINLGIDRHLLERAKDDNKPILEIESAEIQYGMLSGFSEELQILLLESSVVSCENLPAYQLGLTSLMDAWAAGDSDSIAILSAGETEGMTPEELQLYDEYSNAMITTRNISMTEYVENALRSGDTVFVCVGAGHVEGEDGIAQRMKKLGYQVELVH